MLSTRYLDFSSCALDYRCPDGIFPIPSTPCLSLARNKGAVHIAVGIREPKKETPRVLIFFWHFPPTLLYPSLQSSGVQVEVQEEPTAKLLSSTNPLICIAPVRFAHVSSLRSEVEYPPTLYMRATVHSSPNVIDRRLDGMMMTG